MWFTKLLLCLAAAGAGAAAAELNCATFRLLPGAVRIECAGGAAVLIQVPTPSMLRVRVSPDGSFPRSLTERWGFVHDSWTPVPITARDDGHSIRIETPGLRIQARKQPFGIGVSDQNGAPVFEQTGPNRFRMLPAERFYGLGFQRMALDVRGKKLQWWRAFRSSEATVPFFLSSRGYGFYSNNTFRHLFDFTGADEYTVTQDGGQTDYFLFHGPSFKRILDQYTALTGRPLLAPRWALGIGYQSRYFETQAGVLANARGFRREDIPVDWMGLEPGWEAVPYAMNWQWSAERFPEPEAMIRELASMGIKLGLWESGAAPKAGYTNPDVRKAWYAPRIDAAIRKGVRFFKQDDPYPRMISSQEMLEPELNKSLGGSGVFAAAEMNNLTNTLYSETAMNEYTRATGERAMLMFNGYNSSISSHRWPFTWEADFPLGVGALSASLSGHSLVSTRDRNEAPDGIHLGYLAPFCYLESWAYYKEPWLYSEKLLEMNRFYAKLRYRLMPYLYSSARQSTQSGLPLMRPMVLEFQNDPEAHTLATQFLLGDWLLVGSATANLTSGAEQLSPGQTRAETPAKPRIYLPKGRWYDFWTGHAVDSKGQWQQNDWPAHAGGPLWVRGGAIIPMGPVLAYAEQEPLEVLRLDVFPAGNSRYSVYEDDGRTYDYQKGAFAETLVRAAERPGGLTISIGARNGRYQGMPARRGYLVAVHTSLQPQAITVSGRRISQAESSEALLHTSGRSGWTYEPASRTLWIKPAPGWRFTEDSRGPGKDPDRDTAIWNDRAPTGGHPLEISIALAKPVEKPPVFGPPTLVSATAAHPVLIADGTSRAAVTATVRDAAGRRVFGWRGPLRFELTGPGVLGCGSRECVVDAIDGVASSTITSATVTSATATGPLQVRVSASALKPGQTQLEVVRGTLVLKASPPERIKLNSDGAWLPLRATFYATIQSAGVTVKSANTRLRLHVTGGSGKTPEDLEVDAVEGIAVFPNVFFEKPPKYVVSVSGEGVETARIPVY